MNNHYPWNTQALAEWLNNKMTMGENLHELAENMDIPRNVLRDWLVLPFPYITLEQLQRIARYRGFSIEKTAQWLGIRPAHMLELMEQSEMASRV